MGYSVYKLTSPSGKIYIGCTSRKPEYRWNHGRGYRIDHQERMGKAVQKYGWDNFTPRAAGKANEFIRWMKGGFLVCICVCYML